MINETNFKTCFSGYDKKIEYDIGIDDRVFNLKSCKRKLLFTEFRNKNLTEEELTKNNIIRVNDWLDVEKIILNYN